MFGIGFLELFAVLLDDLDSADEEEEERRKKEDLPRGDQHRRNEPIKKPRGKTKNMVALFAILGTLAIMQPNGNVKLYATFPMGGTQMSVLELDTGKTWMIGVSGVHVNGGQIIDYDSGEIYHWNTTDGSRRCGDWKREEEKP